MEARYLRHLEDHPLRPPLPDEEEVAAVRLPLREEELLESQTHAPRDLMVGTADLLRLRPCHYHSRPDSSSSMGTSWELVAEVSPYPCG